MGTFRRIQKNKGSLGADLPQKITMPRKERVSNEHKDMPFFICRLENAVLHYEKGKKTLEVFLERKNFIDTKDLDERGIAKNPWLEELRNGRNKNGSFVKGQMDLIGALKDVTIADAEHPIRWVGSGALLILKDRSGKRHAVLNERHPLSSWPGYMDANGGFSSSIKDMLLPGELGDKELNEEVIIKRDGKRIPITAKPLKFPGSTTAVVHFKGQVFTTPDLILVVDAETGVIDFRRIVEMEIDDIKNFTFEDGETRYTGKNEEVLQGRKIFTMTVDRLLVYKSWGEKMTPALKAIVEKLEYIKRNPKLYS